MPAAVRRLKASSHSRLMKFEQCKYRAWLEFGERIPDPKPSTAGDRGTRIHDEAERFVRGKLKKLPVECAKHFEPEFMALKREFKSGKVSLEGEWAFDTEWNPVEWRSDKVWIRLKCDATAWLSPSHLLVVDYKSGKRWGNEIKHGEQMQLYLLSVLLRYPEIQTVTVELWYLDVNDLVQQTFTREQGLRYLPGYTKRFRKMTEETVFPPNPNIFSCKWCPYSMAGTQHCKASTRVVSALHQGQPRAKKKAA